MFECLAVKNRCTAEKFVAFARCLLFKEEQTNKRIFLPLTILALSLSKAVSVAVRGKEKYGTTHLNANSCDTTIH